MELRLDTYLWVIRIFKSRSLASETIKAGRVKLNEEAIKASRMVKIGEIYSINLSPTNKKIIKVTGLQNKRGNSDAAKKLYEDLSPIATKETKIEKAFFTMNIKNEKGSGRPTKKNRRKLDEEGGWF